MNEEIKPNDLQKISSQLAGLKKLDVFQVSEIREILLTIDPKLSHGVAKWKSQVELAVYNCNSEIYKKLIDLESEQ